MKLLVVIVCLGIAGVFADEEESEQDTCIDWAACIDSVMPEMKNDCGLKDNEEDEEKLDEAYYCAMSKKGIEIDGEIYIDKMIDHFKPHIKKNGDEIMKIIKDCSKGEPKMKEEDFDKCFDEEMKKICPNDIEESEEKKGE